MTRESRQPTSTADLFRWIDWAQVQAGQEWVRERELTREQAFVLGYLVQNPGAIQRDIARVSHTTAGSVTSLLQGLERRNLVERRAEAGNARVKRVFATAAGADLVSGFEEAMTAAQEAILAPLTAAERATLHGLLTKITTGLPLPSR